MAIGPHVNGPAWIYLASAGGYDARTGSGATPPTLSKLGVSVDGVDVDPTPKFRPINADTGGPDVPVTEQATGFDCLLTMDVVIYDPAVLVVALKQPGQTVEGLMESVGYLMGPTDYKRLFIAAPNADGGPYNFPTARLAKRPVKLSTLRNIWRLQWYAFAYVGVALTSAGAVLYNSDTTGYTP